MSGETLLKDKSRATLGVASRDDTKGLQCWEAPDRSGEVLAVMKMLGLIGEKVGGNSRLLSKEPGWPLLKKGSDPTPNLKQIKSPACPDLDAMLSTGTSSLLNAMIDIGLHLHLQ
eukprot:g3578.t1